MPRRGKLAEPPVVVPTSPTVPTGHPTIRKPRVPRTTPTVLLNAPTEQTNENAPRSNTVVSTPLWLLINVLFPFSPVVLEGILRFVTAEFNPDCIWGAFSGANLAMTAGLVLFFVALNIQNQLPALDDSDDEPRIVRKFWFAFTLILVFICLGLSFCATLLDGQAAFAKDPQIQKYAAKLIASFFGPAACTTPVFVIIYSLIAQVNLKLEVALW